MEANTFYFQNTSISYFDKGKGTVLLFLHGFLETKEFLSEFAELFTDRFRVIVPDIPGHGKSGTLGKTHSMELMAEALQQLLVNLQINQCFLIGHSMGGYVALSLAESFPNTVAGLVLFHSSVYADSEAKKQSRLTDIEWALNNRLPELIQNHIPKTFAPHTISRFEIKIKHLIIQSGSHSPVGVSALIRGMMERNDKQQFISGFNKPLLLLMGTHDPFINPETSQKMAQLNKTIRLAWLENSGHMGFIEEPELAHQKITLFILSNLNIK